MEPFLLLRGIERTKLWCFACTACKNRNWNSIGNSNIRDIHLVKITPLLKLNLFFSQPASSSTRKVSRLSFSASCVQLNKPWWPTIATSALIFILLGLGPCSTSYTRWFALRRGLESWSRFSRDAIFLNRTNLVPGDPCVILILDQLPVEAENNGCHKTTGLLKNVTASRGCTRSWAGDLLTVPTLDCMAFWDSACCNPRQLCPGKRPWAGLWPRTLPRAPQRRVH